MATNATTAAKKSAAKAELKAKAAAAKAASAAAKAQAAKAAPEKRPAAVPTGGRDAWGAGLSTGTHVVNKCIGEAKGPMTTKAIGAYSHANGGRDAVGAHLNCLRLRGLIESTAGGWQATPAGKALWGGKAVPKDAVVLTQAAALGTSKPKGDSGE